MEKKNLTPQEAKNILWRKGNLKWKLHDIQKIIYDQFYTNEDSITTLLIARQSGKSFLMCVLAIETCLRNPNSIVKYACPKQRMVKNILKPIMRQILEDCPRDIKPEYKEADKIYVFPNGSEIQMAGTDNGNYDNIRGGKAHLWIVDEAGFCNDLNTVVYSVLQPTTLTTKGRGIMASTPDPDQPEHDFIKIFVEPAELKGNLFKYTLYDNQLIDEAEKQKIIDQYPNGIENPRFRAEYLCEVVRNGELSVVPEFTDTLAKEIVYEYKAPGFKDCYVSMDIGVRDLTVVLFGYYDYLKATVVIEDEFIINGNTMTTDKLAEGIKTKEKALWGVPGQDSYKPPYLRVADNNNLILLNDLNLLHNLLFFPTAKDNKEAAVNFVRLKLSQKQLVIHPRCKTLIYHLKNATWDKTRTSFSRTLADGSHFDAVDSLIYFLRNVVYGKNPYPAGWGMPSSENHYTKHKTDAGNEALNNIFKTKIRSRINK